MLLFLVFIVLQMMRKQKIETSGNISVVSKYISRGLTNAPENDDVALQAALNLAYGNFMSVTGAQP